MPVTVIVGGQFGSEGKGKVAHILASEMGATAAVRVGGPNSGHTAISEHGIVNIFKQLPTAALLPDVHCVLAAGSYIYPNIFFEELESANISPSRVMVDKNAVVITDSELAQEGNSGLRGSIGSTLSGTGGAVLARAARQGTAVLAKDYLPLKPFIFSSLEFLRGKLSNGERLIVEGTQGFGLSVIHSPYYPYATSRDTTAAGFISEVGLSPLDVDDIVMVLRAFPIRVPGNSGPLPNETNWDAVTSLSGSPIALQEFTSVTRALRRIARFDPSVVRSAIACNNPTRIVINHIDYVDHLCSKFGGLTDRAEKFIQTAETLISRRIDYVGVGPSSLIKR